ncbi:hypothetical protein H7X87_02730 [Acetobacteraceae bacterium]|nr:hypothetical protein [Candidatus Parcubacteria bacterium]
MRYFFAGLIFFLPFTVFASCISDNVTVVYVNGVFTTKEQAQDDLKTLRRKYEAATGDHRAEFLNGFNPSHITGVGDIAKTWLQDRGVTNDYDLKTILLNLHDDLSTQKILLVGHSQGTYYTNAMYDYLIAHGVPKESINIYNIATPASFVAGKGKYLNSSGDSLLRFVRSFGFKPLTNNIDLVSSVDEALTDWPGHSLSSAYLAEAPERIVSDISNELEGLKANTKTTSQEGCFTSPAVTALYRAQDFGFKVTDPTAIAIKDGAILGYKGAVAAARITAALAKASYITIASAAEKITHPFSFEVGTPAQDVATFEVFKALYGPSLERVDVEELIKNQGAAVVLAGKIVEKPQPVGEVLGVQTEIPSTAYPVAKIFNSKKSSSSDDAETASVSEESIDSPKEIPEPVVESNPPPTDDPVVPPQLEVPAPQVSGYDPVVIIPTLFGSRKENGVWSINPTLHVYDSLISTFKTNSYGEGQDLFTFPYDWQKSYVSTAQELENKIGEIKTICGCSKVDIVAHGTGGFIAQQYVDSASYGNDVDQLVLLGTPLLGLPNAYKMVEAGEIDFGNPTLDAQAQNFLMQEAHSAGFENIFAYIHDNRAPAFKEMLPLYNYLFEPGLVSLQYPNGYEENPFILKILTNFYDELIAGSVRTSVILADTQKVQTQSGFVVQPSDEVPLWPHGKPVSTLVDSGDDFTPRVSIENFAAVDKEFAVDHWTLPTAAKDYIFKVFTGHEPI